MNKIENGNSFLTIGGYFSLAFAVFQLSAVLWSPDTIRYFGGPAELSRSRPLIYALLCALVGVIAGIMGLYALSGAGKIRRLPLLRSILTFITMIYLLRGLQLVTDITFVIRNPGLVRFAVFSMTALCVGLFHLAGLIRLWRRNPAHTMIATQQNTPSI